jgi:hypothetical protein
MKTSLITLLNLIIITTSCFAQESKREAIEGHRSSSEFYAIHASSSITVILKPGDNESVIVETNAESQKQLLVSAKDGVLRIELTGKVIKPIEFKVHVTAKKTEDSTPVGSGELKSIGSLDFQVLSFSISGSYSIKLKEKHKDFITKPLVWLSEHSFLMYCKIHNMKATNPYLSVLRRM